MDETSIARIEALTAAAQQAMPAEFLGKAIVLPKDARIESLEKYAGRPKAFRGTFKTPWLTSFVSYCLANTAIETQAVVFIDPDSMRADAIFDFGSPALPSWPHHKAILAARQTHAWQALMNIVWRPQSQESVIDFIVDYQSVLQFEDGDGRGMTAATAIQAIRKVKISKHAERTEEKHDFSEAHSDLERMEIESSSQSMLPRVLLMKTEVYYGMGPVEIRVNLRAAASDGKGESKSVALHLRIEGQDNLEESLALDFRDMLGRALGDNIVLHIGTWSS